MTIRWTKNNHNGGFIRLSLIPITQMFDALSFRKLAFYYGCFEQGVFACREKNETSKCSKCSDCGSDPFIAFRRTIQVPTIVPDGTYVLGFIWYGGLDFTRQRGKFPDYTSCSFVKIEGGTPISKSYKPIFEPGDTGRFQVVKGKCLSYFSQPGQFISFNDSAKKLPFYGKPVPFNKNERIAVLRPTDFESSDGESGICNSQVCCHLSCGECGGFGCGERPGGAHNCCESVILRSAVKCSSGTVPCIVEKRNNVNASRKSGKSILPS